MEPVLSIGLLILILALWWAGTAFTSIPEFVVPKPMTVVNWLIQGFSVGPSSPASLWYHLFVTAYEAFLGFAIGASLGVVLGMALAHRSMAERVLYPYIVAFQSLPKIAIAPLLVVWFGFGIEAKIAKSLAPSKRRAGSCRRSSTRKPAP
jgi:NitT/TauT family transport system permease protein